MEMTEKTFEELYSKADILYFLLDSDATILSCNTTVENKFGRAENDWMGKKFLSLIPEPYTASMENAIQSCINKGYIKDFETCIRSDPNHHFHVRLNGLVQSDTSGNVEYVRLYVQDVTEQVELRRENDFLFSVLTKMQSAKDSDRKIKEMLNDIQVFTGSQGIGYFLRDCSGSPLNLVTWNDSDVDTSYGTDFRKWSSDAWHQLIETARGIKSARFTPDGSLWTESLSDLLVEMSSMEDKEALISLSNFESVGMIRIPESQKGNHYLVITHREKCRWKENAMLFLESVVAVLGQFQPFKDALPKIQTLPLVQALMDVPWIGVLAVKNERIEHVNRWVEDCTELGQAELLGKPVYDLFDPECVAPFRAWISALEDPGSGVYDKELVSVSKSGKRCVLYCSVMRSRENGNPLELWYWAPKSEQAEFQEQWMHIKRMEYLGMLAGSLVLDFNNVLSCILGYTSLLSEEISNESPYYEDLQQIKKTAEKATELTSRLLASAQGTPYIMDDLDANILVKEVAAYLSKTTNKNIVIRAELDSNVERIHADASQLQQTILQIALNARDAMQGGGKLFFQTRNYRVSEADTHLHPGSRPGDYVQIAISDTGSGMTGNVKDRFLRQAVPQTIGNSGKGLGLAMVRQIVDKHNGFISVFSEAGKGTLVKMHFPVGEGKKPVSGFSSGKPAFGKETILLVDDEASLRETVKKMLTRYGYKVIGTDNGTEAIAIYKKNTDRIQLIILDLFMPGLEIHKVLSWFKKLNPKVKILASVGMDERSEVEDSVNRNVTGFVQKPFQLRPLLESIQNVLNA